MNHKQKQQLYNYDAALSSLKHILPKQQISQKQTIHDQATTKLNRVFLSCKKQRLMRTFVQKLKRNVIISSPPNDIKQSWQKQSEQFGIQGNQYEEQLWYTIQFLHLIALLILLFVSTFNGFIQVFANAYSNQFGVVLCKSISLAVMIIYFCVFCTRKTYYKGNTQIFIKDILKAYVHSFRIFADLVVIFLTISFIVCPTCMEIGMLLFVVVILNIILSNPDLIRVSLPLFRSKKQRLIYNALKIFIFNILFAHCLATILLGMLQYDANENWIIRHHGSMDDLEWYQIYIDAFYWATTFMMAVGFGDIVPSNHKQKLTIAFLELVGCVILAYNISQIGSMMSSIRQKNEQKKTKLTLLQEMYSRNNKKKRSLGLNQIKIIDPLLQRRIYNYINQDDVNTKQQIFLNQQEQLIQSLPHNLKLAFYKQTYTPLLQQMQFFKYLKPATLQKISTKIQNKYFSYGKYFTTHKNDDIFILQRGLVGLTFRKFRATVNGYVVDQIIRKNNTLPIFLNIDFLTFKNNISYGLLAQTQCHIWQINKLQLIQALSISNIDQQFYFSVRHKNHFDQNQFGLIQCPRCFGMMHTSFQCPKLHYIPLKSQIIEKSLRLNGQEQQRTRFKRKKKIYRKIHALITKTTFYEGSEQFYKRNKQKHQTDVQAEIQHNNNDQKYYNMINNRRIQNQNIQEVVLKALIKHQFGYQQEFWRIETDKAQNYHFYFPLLNPNRLVYTSLQQIDHKHFTQRG